MSQTLSGRAHAQLKEDLPFFVAGTLDSARHQVIEDHVRRCGACSEELLLWQAAARGVAALTDPPNQQQPPRLTGTLRLALQPRRSVPHLLATAVSLVWAQRVVVLRGIHVPVTLLLIISSFVAAAALEGAATILPLLVILPIAAALYAALLSGPAIDPVWSLIQTSGAPPSAVVFARLALALALLTFTAGASGWVLELLTGSTLQGLTVAWLGPMWLLAALTTLLALAWKPLIAAGVSITLWLGFVVVIHAELAGVMRPPISVLPALQPGLLLISCQLITALLLWLVAWYLLQRELLPVTRSRWQRKPAA